jgi:hypothetical protein
MPDACGWFPLTREQIQAWVERHSHELPQTLSEISRFPMPFRKAIVAAVAPEIRAALWKAHMESFLTPPSELTEPQRELVRDAMVELPVILTRLDVAGQRAGERELQALQGRARDLMVPEQIMRIFGTLGPPEPPEGLPLPPDALP